MSLFFKPLSLKNSLNFEFVYSIRYFVLHLHVIFISTSFFYYCHKIHFLEIRNSILFSNFFFQKNGFIDSFITLFVVRLREALIISYYSLVRLFCSLHVLIIIASRSYIFKSKILVFRKENSRQQQLTSFFFVQNYQKRFPYMILVKTL